MIRLSRSGDVALILFENPPVNALSVGKGMVEALGNAVRQAADDPRTGAIVIGAPGRCFSAGADLADFDTRNDTLDRLRWLMTDMIENAAKPVVMAIHGAALGGGLELALAGHYRLAAPEATFALPEVKFGLLPGSGGTQRLPRLVGVAFARAMMLSGDPVDATTALEKGLIDRIVADDPIPAAMAFAAAHIGEAPRRVRDRVPFEGEASAVASLRPSRSRAPAFILRCVEAAMTQPFAEGMALEKELFETLRLSEESRGLRHVFLARREVGHIPGIDKSVPVQTIAAVAVVGAGLMGTGIATALIHAGLEVTLIEPQPEMLEKAMANIRRSVTRDVEKGRLSEPAAAARLERLSVAASVAAAAHADLVIEAVYENMAVKQQVFAEIDRVAKPSAILASNTSTLDLDAIASGTAQPERVLGLHFFSPAHVMPLVEVVRGRATAREALASAMAFTRAIGKVGVVSGVCDGFIGNRMFEEYLRQAYFLLEEGALPQQVDAALEAFGMAMGPFRVMDLAGQDIGWSIRKRRAAEQPDRPYSKLPDLICEMGRFGQKTGAGFYLYPDGRTATADPAIDALVAGYAQKLGLAPRQVDDAEIVERCIFALVNEGAKLLAEGIAYRAIDIDMVYVHGYGFPNTRGGPMFHADRCGLKTVLEKIRQFGKGRHGWAWTPAPLLVRLAEAGGSFGDMRQGHD